jgi:gliding motility-associated-like protein
MFKKIYPVIVLTLMTCRLAGQSQCLSTANIAGSQTVCSDGNSGSVRLVGFSGTVLRWEMTTSTTPGAIWSVISGNSTDSVHFQNISSTTYYRAFVQTGVCTPDYSPVATVNVNPATVSGSILRDTAVCRGNNKTTLQLSGATGNVMKWQYAVNPMKGWNDIITTSTSYNFLNLDSTTYFRVSVKSGVCSLVFSAPTKITVNPLPVADFSAPAACLGKNNVMKSTAHVDEGTIIAYQWDLGDGSRSFQPEVNKRYYYTGPYLISLTVTTDKGCTGTMTRNTYVREVPKALFSFTNACLGHDVNFNNQSSISNGQQINYLWNFGDGAEAAQSSTAHQYPTAGSYTVTLYAISALDLCIDSIKNMVQVYSLPRASAGKDTSVAYNKPFTLNASGGTTYYWQSTVTLQNPRLQNPVVTLTDDAIFKVTVIDANNCIATDSVKVSVIRDEDLVPSNVLTPDGNGQNDTWFIRNIEGYPNATVHIFNRWGQEVYQTMAYQNNWDGRNYKGDNLPDGTYYYVITFGGSDKVYKGAITLLRNK